MESKKDVRNDGVKAIDYINSMWKCIPYPDDDTFPFTNLTDFLKSNNLSCKLEYYYYLAGRLQINRFNLPKEVIMWHKQFNSKLMDRDFLIDFENREFKEIVSPSDRDISQHNERLAEINDFSSEKFIKEFWESVKIEEDYENWLAFRNIQDEMLNQDESYTSEGSFCNACQNSPCMCSDPEKTSTVF